MRVTLPESQRMRKRSTGITTCSIVLHVAVLGVAVVTTARSEVRTTAVTPEVVRFVEPKAPPAPIVTPADEHGGFAPVTQGLFAPIEIPETLPPIDLATSGFDPAEWARGVTQGAAPPTVAEPIRTAGAPFTEGDVEKAVVMRAGNPAPRYPRMLQQAGMEGEVVVRFVVDTLGVVETSSIAVMQTTHELFGRSVLDALARMKFIPAEAGGHRVRQLVEQRFGFEMK